MGFTLQLLEEKGYTGAQFMKDLGWVVVAIVSIAGAFMTVYAIYIAYLFATATDANKRKAAKDRLMKTVASALIVAACASVLAVITVRFDTTEGSVEGPQGGEIGSMVSGITYGENPYLSIDAVENNDGGPTSLVLKGYFNINSRALVNANGEKIDPSGTNVVFDPSDLNSSKMSTAPDREWGNGLQCTTKKPGSSMKFEFAYGIDVVMTNQMFKCTPIHRGASGFVPGFRLIVPAIYHYKSDNGEIKDVPLSIVIEVQISLTNKAKQVVDWSYE